MRSFSGASSSALIPAASSSEQFKYIVACVVSGAGSAKPLAAASALGSLSPNTMTDNIMVHPRVAMARAAQAVFA